MSYSVYHFCFPTRGKEKLKTKNERERERERQGEGIEKRNWEEKRVK